MSENIKNAATESAQNAAGAAEAVTHDMTAEAVNEPVQADAGVYTHTFKKPFEYAGETYTTLTFDFEKMTGRDMVSIETEMPCAGSVPEFSSENGGKGRGHR